jgi:hypothetical protein
MAHRSALEEYIGAADSSDQILKTGISMGWIKTKVDHAKKNEVE